jgi:DNA-binding XRE family transcriptional regulator
MIIRELSEAAKLLGISRQMLNNIIHEKADVTPDMAYRKNNLHLAAERAKEFKSCLTSANPSHGSIARITNYLVCPDCFYLYQYQ